MVTDLFPQLAMLERPRQVCQADERLEAALQYGSFARGGGDRFSDLDCQFYFREETLAAVDPLTWISQIAPVGLYYVNEFGVGAAVFENLVRAEYHFDPESAMEKLPSLQGALWFPSLEDAIMLDRHGALARHLKPLVGLPPRRGEKSEIENLGKSLVNWTLFGTNVLQRGENARALEILMMLHDTLLRLARLQAGNIRHWITPSKNLEAEIPKQAYERYRRTVATLETASLRDAYWNAWTWGTEMLLALVGESQAALPVEIMQKLESSLEQFWS